MTLVNKLSCIKYLIICFFIIAIATLVNAQVPVSKSSVDKANFTQFTSQKTYPDLVRLRALTPASFRNHPDFGKSYAKNPQWYEQLDKRTLKTRTYSGPCNEVITENARDNINYIDANGWMRAVDTKLKPYGNGWTAEQQEIPVYLYPDASTALSVGYDKLMTFNKNVQFNQNGISTSDHTVGDNGMYIKNAIPGIDKIIRFGRGRIETDYKINTPLKLNGDLIISEDIILPAGYTISENNNYNSDEDVPGSLLVKDPSGKIVAELKAPLCYDNDRNSIIASYSFTKQADGYKLEMDVPSSWLNNASRQYPITIDPVVTGPTSVWSGGVIYSCLNTFGDDTGSILVAVPPDITITAFQVSASIYDTTTNIPLNHALFWFWTSCGDSLTTSYTGTDTSAPGWVYLIPDSDNFLQYVPNMLCCIKPACSYQFFNLTMGLLRNKGGTGCNKDYIYYNPSNDYGYPFEAYLIGRTVEGSFSAPDSICASQCSFKIGVTANYGVPPYTITHPWSKDTLTFGGYSTDSCTSVGNDSLTITIPNCPGVVCTASVIKIPPPKITDACGRVFAGLDSQAVALKASPNVLATPDTQTVCSGGNISIALSSCASGATYTWTSSEGANGLGTPIIDAPNNNTINPITVNYFVTPMANGCAGTVTAFPVKVTPFTVLITPSSKTLCEGDSIDLSVSGDATTYSWSPVTGLSCTTCNNLIADPTITTTYTVLGTNGGSCLATNSITIKVKPGITLGIIPPNPLICDGQNVTLSVTGDALNYVWSPLSGLNVTTGDTVVASPTATTTYTVADVDTNSCGEKDSVIVIVIPSPNKPTFTHHGDTLISSSKYDNQWYRNDTLLLNDTSQDLIITVLGEYWVNVNNEANGCSTASDSVKIDSITGINQLSLVNGQLSIYPNPFNDEIFIKINSSAGNIKDWMMQLNDVLGTTLYSLPSLNYTNEIDLSNLPAGMYFITIITNTGRAVFPVVRQN